MNWKATLVLLVIVVGLGLFVYFQPEGGADKSDAKKVLPKIEGSYDMVFLDAVKGDYLGYLKSCERLLRAGSVVVADNVKSHAEEVAGYLDYVRNSGRFKSTYREASSNYRYGAGNSEPDAVEISVML